MRVGSFSADPGQFPFRWVERAGDYLSVRKMAGEPCSHHNHPFVLIKVISHFGTGCAWARTLNRKKSDVQIIPGQIR